MKFEDKIIESAQRMVAEQNANLHVPGNPFKQNRHYWGWITTPAAVLVGIVFGLSYQQFAKKPNERIAHTVDTILVPQVQHDTVWLAHVEKKERVVDSIQSSTPTNAKKEEPVCTSVSCDGIDYALLASN